MNKFILIDHSLRDVGGHYYTYACCVLPAAERAGYRPVLAVNRQFSDHQALPKSWSVHTAFRHKSYASRLHAAPAGPKWLRKLQGALARVRDENIANSFAVDCARLFQSLPLLPGDHVFLATATELDLYGLGLFLQRQSFSGVTWHVQFHVGLFVGRYPQYAKQLPDRGGLRRYLAAALALTVGHDVRLYCTTEQLSAQYNLLGVTHFATLTYPVHEMFHMDASRAPSSGPIRIACLGHNRKEKGYRILPEIIRAVWSDYLSNGRAQLVLQTARQDLRRALGTLVEQLGANSTPSAQCDGNTAPVAYASFPLALENYAELVRTSGIGLLLYDGSQYYARCSGVLIEMLVAGAPVIVPAGCWLAEQIDEENQRYLEGVVNSQGSAALARCAPQATEWRVGMGVGEGTRDAIRSLPGVAASATWIVVAGGVQGEFAMSRCSESTSLLVRFRLRRPALPGIYVRVEIAQLDEKGVEIHRFAQIVAPRTDDGLIHALYSLVSETRSWVLRVSNAWHDSEIAVGDLECFELGGSALPMGSVGVTAVAVEQSGELLSEVLRHYNHYRRHAARFSKYCIELHDAAKIIDRLTRDARTASRELAEAV